MGHRRRRTMPPKPAKPAGYNANAKKKAMQKKLWTYGSLAVVGLVVVVFFLHAEYQSGAERQWAATYERRCEACQTMVTSGILTRSMIHQQEKKRMSEERVQILEQNPEAELPPEEEPKIGAGPVIRYMCQEQQIDALLANNRFMFGNGYATIEDPDFGPSLKKLCWFAMSNSTMTKILKRMLEVPTEPTAKPTLVSLSQAHFAPVCVGSSSMCTAEELEHGAMVDPQAEQQVEDMPEDDGQAGASVDSSDPAADGTH